MSKLEKTYTITVKAKFGNYFQQSVFERLIVSNFQTIKKIFEDTYKGNKVKVKFE